MNIKLVKSKILETSLINSFYQYPNKLVMILNIVVGKTTALIIQNIIYQKYLINPSPI